MKRSKHALALLALAISGCKLVIIAPPHVAVGSEDMNFMCLPGNTCEIDVSDYQFDMSFYAIPKPGYSFLHWKSDPGHLCPGFFSNKCHVSTVGIDPADHQFATLLHSSARFYLEPVYRRDETAPTLDWESIESP